MNISGFLQQFCRTGSTDHTRFSSEGNRTGPAQYVLHQGGSYRNGTAVSTPRLSLKTTRQILKTEDCKQSRAGNPNPEQTSHHQTEPAHPANLCLISTSKQQSLHVRGAQQARGLVLEQVTSNELLLVLIVIEHEATYCKQINDHDR